MLFAPLLACFCVLPAAQGHGLISKPTARTADMPVPPPYTYCPHCLSAGGIKVQSKGGSIPFIDAFPSTAVHSICGDPLYGEKFNLESRPDGKEFPVTDMSVGADGTIAVEVVITTNHWGKMCFHVFEDPQDVADGNEAAGILLMRADGKGACVFPPLQDGQDGDGLKSEGQATHSDWISGFGDKYSAQLTWPAGLACSGRCVMHMHWTTGHSCTPPGVPSANMQVYGAYPVVACGSDGAPYPEQFWNCADFRVSGGGQQQDAVSAESLSTPAFTAGK